MEFNAELLEEIILGASRLDNENPDERLSLEESTKGSESVVAPHATPGTTRRDAGQRDSLRLNASQLADARSAALNGTTPRATTERDSMEKAAAKTPRMVSTPRGSGSMTPRSSSSIDENKLRKGKTLFDDLCHKTGLDNAMKWFEVHSVPYEREMTEKQFMQFIQSLTKFYDWEVYDILDILDRKHTGTVTWEAFYILLALYTAYHSKRLTKFLYKHGTMAFQFLLDPVNKRLTFERFSRLGFLVGLSEDDILETCLVFGFRKNAMEMMGQEDFLLFYYSIFHTIDTGLDLLKDTQSLPYSTTSGKSSTSQSNSKASAYPSGQGMTSGAQAHQKCIIS